MNRKNYLRVIRDKKLFSVYDVILLGAVCLIAVLLYQSIAVKTGMKSSPEGKRAARLMSLATDTVKEYREREGPSLAREADPNLTGLIGDEYTAMTTTLGNLQAKRTTTNPNFATLVVRLFEEAGLSRGASIGIAASGSFPGVVIAVLSAARTMGIEPVIIYSLGSSSWGANLIGFTLLDMHRILRQEGIYDFPVAAASLGGSGDLALGVGAQMRAALKGKIDNYDLEPIFIEDLELNVERRIEIYREHSTGGIDCFVNIGGSLVSLGGSLEALNLKPGTLKPQEIPRSSSPGLIFEMAEEEIPVIHLLNIKDLVLEYGLPWDPIPLPEPDGQLAVGSGMGGRWAAWVALSMCLVAFGAIWLKNKIG